MASNATCSFDTASRSALSNPMSDGIILTSHTDVFARMASTSKKDLKTLWLEEARRCFGGTTGKSGHPGIAGITPPYSAGAGQSASVAKKHADALIASDVHSLYGTPSDAYDALKSTSPSKASAFWFLQMHDEKAQAKEIVRSTLGKSLSPFDEGKLHQSNFRFTGLRRRRAKQGRAFSVVYYVDDAAALDAYIKLEQSHVWWLASGWAEPLRALGAKLPAGVKKLPAPGHLRVIITDDKFEITAGNDVSFSGQVKDMNRRIGIVLNDYRVSRLNRAWVEYLASQARKAGFKKT